MKDGDKVRVKIGCHTAFDGMEGIIVIISVTEEVAMIDFGDSQEEIYVKHLEKI